MSTIWARLQTLDWSHAVKKFLGNFLLGGFIIGTFVFVADVVSPIAAGVASGVPIGLIVLFLIKLEHVNKFVTSHLVGIGLGFSTFVAQFIMYVIFSMGLITSSLLSLVYWVVAVVILVRLRVSTRLDQYFFPDDPENM